MCFPVNFVVNSYLTESTGHSLLPFNLIFRLKDYAFFRPENNISLAFNQ